MKLKIHKSTLTMTRIGAAAIDMFLISFVYGVIVAIATGNYSAVTNRFYVSFGNYKYDLIFALVLMLLYFVFLPLVWKGLTVGKKITRTRIVMEDGDQVGLNTLLLRFITIVLPNIILLGMPAIVNIYIMLFRKDNKGYHDIVAKTKIVSVL
ncbi:RDD family protein [Ectobacillus sp. JY-23]|uniref:RDD family protein n=1 Tax=Ectobacillus sp. JY-23 TaxID=2933872 RepID=UPI001FF59D6F|nr:RDD family protein [Ectobacillus sp. JY-23]UOY93820.1 RDD family protein [Ectobacillus sp. JY-23]